MPQYQQPRYGESAPQKKSNIGWIFLVVALAAIVIFTLLSLRTVSDKDACAWIRFGRVVGEAKPGLQLRPLIDSKTCFSAQTRLYQTLRPNESGKLESAADYKDYFLTARTKDGQEVEIMFNLLWHVNQGDAGYIRNNVASSNQDLVDRVIATVLRSTPRDVVLKYDMPQLNSTKRLDAEAEMGALVTAELAKYRVQVDGFALRDLLPSAEYQAQVEETQRAQQIVEQRKYEAEQAIYTAQATVETAKGQANAAVIAAQGEADATRIRAQAEADSMRLRGEALEKYPSVLQLEFYTTLKTVNWMILPSGSVPLLDLQVAK